jgi:chromosome partitioning protein
VGKTTTCLSLGACLAELSYTTLLIDLDPQAHMTMSLGIRPEQLSAAVGDVLLGDGCLTDISQKTSLTGLDVAPANQELALIEKRLYGVNDYEFQLKRQLGALEPHAYDFVLIDCAPTFGTTTLNALTAADLLLIPMQCEYYAAQSLRPMVELAKLVQQRTNAGLHYRVLVTLYDRRNGICRIIREQMQEELSQLLFETTIEIDTRLREGPAFGQPITLYAPRSRGARQYRALARELTNHGR